MTEQVCQHFLVDKCKRGEKCKWSHAVATKPFSSATGAPGTSTSPSSPSSSSSPPSSTQRTEATVCQHFLVGKCKRGEKCKWSHATVTTATTASPPVKLCEHFLNNKCTRGDKCRFSHAPAPPPKSNKVKKSTQTCTHFLNGTCTRGIQCRYEHPEGEEGSSRGRKRAGLQGRQKRKDWLRYGSGQDNVFSVVKVSVGCVHLDAPLCKHNARCAKRKVDKPSAKRYGKQYWCCHKIVTGQTQDNCGFFKWVEDTAEEVERAKKRRKFDDDDDGSEEDNVEGEEEEPLNEEDEMVF